MRRSFDAWLDYLNSLHPTAIDLGLERIQPLAEAMGLTHFSCPVVTVAGTNGKGSCVRFLECIYLAAGFRVAAYTSPHLLHFSERLRINDESLSDELWLEAFEAVEQARVTVSLTFFEFTTLAALWLCRQNSLDVMILEVGLGGRLDAVNIVENDLAVITSIDFDHQEYLGNTREAIAREKAGIFKENNLAVCGDGDIPLSVFEAAEQKNVVLYALNRDYFYELYDQTWVWIGPQVRYDHLALTHLNVQNAATSLMVVDLLQEKLAVNLKIIQKALRETRLPGRFEEIKTPLADLYLDVAHNPQSVNYLCEKLAALQQKKPSRTLAVFAMLRDKEAEVCIESMLPFIDEWYVPELPTERARPAAELAELIVAHGKTCYTFASVAEALTAALGSCQLPDRVIVFGSFYTVAGATEWLQRAEPDLGPAEEQAALTERRVNVTPKMRHRIVGLLVLLGLVALFLPLLFSNNDPIENVASLAKRIPEAPKMPQVKMELNTPKLDANSETLAATAGTEKVAEISDTTPTSVPVAPTPEASTSSAADSHPANASGVAVTPLVNTAKPVAGTSDTAETTPLPSTATVKNPVVAAILTDAPEAWTIQVGSFSNNATAQALVHKLREQGFEAYTREITTSQNKQVTRVFVGPEIDRAKLVLMQHQLVQEFKLSGVIAKYSVN